MAKEKTKRKDGVYIMGRIMDIFCNMKNIDDDDSIKLAEILENLYVLIYPEIYKDSAFVDPKAKLTKSALEKMHNNDTLIKRISELSQRSKHQEDLAHILSGFSCPFRTSEHFPICPCP